MSDERGADEGRAAFDAEQARAQEDQGRASDAAAGEAEALTRREEAWESSVALVPGMRVELCEERGSLLAINLGKVIKISKSGYVHVEWDDGTDGWFSPAKAASTLRIATGDDALPRHLWIFEVPDREAESWRAPLPTLDEPVCAVCREKQTDENEYGPCKPKPKEPDAV